MRLSGLVSHRRRRVFMNNANGVSRGDRNRNARLDRLRELVRGNVGRSPQRGMVGRNVRTGPALLDRLLAGGEVSFYVPRR